MKLMMFFSNIPLKTQGFLWSLLLTGALSACGQSNSGEFQKEAQSSTAQSTSSSTAWSGVASSSSLNELLDAGFSFSSSSTSSSASTSTSTATSAEYSGATSTSHSQSSSSSIANDFNASSSSVSRASSSSSVPMASSQVSSAAASQSSLSSISSDASTSSEVSSASSWSSSSSSQDVSPLSSQDSSSNFSSSSTASTSSLPNLDQITQVVRQNIIEDKCLICHQNNSLAENSRLLFAEDSLSNKHIIEQVQFYLDTASNTQLLNKVQGLLGHGGGAVLNQQHELFNLLSSWLELINPSDGISPVEQSKIMPLEDLSQSLRRAALILAGRLPTANELARMEVDENNYRVILYEYMESPNFHSFLIESANKRLLTDAIFTDIELELFKGQVKYYPYLANKKYKAEAEAGESLREYKAWQQKLNYGLARSPLELIAYVVENNRPYTEILTADYSMINPQMNEVFNSGLSFNSEDHRVFKPGTMAGQTVLDDFYQTIELDEGVQNIVAFNQEVQLPAAGLLTNLAMLNRYPSSNSNRNRARARWVYYHFLALDIERLAPAPQTNSSPVSNPTLNDPNCTVCHRLLDPVAASFENYGYFGTFNDGLGGLDSLPNSFRSNSKNYQPGDTWYRTMLPPGFEQAVFGKEQNPILSLSQAITQDERFAKAAIAFWWPSIMATPFPYSSKTESTADSASNLEADKQQWIKQLAKDFALGIKGGSAYNAKDLLVELLESTWFRLDKGVLTEDGSQFLPEAQLQLLSTRQLEQKTFDLTGQRWQASASTSIYQENLGEVSGEYKSAYGEQDSMTLAAPLAFTSALTKNIALTQALELACPSIYFEFAKDAHQRKQLSYVSRFTSAQTLAEESISVAANAGYQSFTSAQEFEVDGSALELLVGSTLPAKHLDQHSIVITALRYIKLDKGETTTIPASEFAQYLGGAAIQFHNNGIPAASYFKLSNTETDASTSSNIATNTDTHKIPSGWHLMGDFFKLSLGSIPPGRYRFEVDFSAASQFQNFDTQIHWQGESSADFGLTAIKKQIKHLAQNFWAQGKDPELQEELFATYLALKEEYAPLVEGSFNEGHICGSNSGIDSSDTVYIIDYQHNLDLWTSMYIYLMSSFNYLHE